MSFKIYAQHRLILAEKNIKDLSDSALRRIAKDTSDKRSSQAKQELKNRARSKQPASQSKKRDMNPLVKTYKGLSRWNTKRKINQLNREEKNDLNTHNWFFGPTERDFEGNKYERKRKLNDYINNRRQEIHTERDELTKKLNRLNDELGN